MLLQGRQIAPVVRPLRTLIRPSVVAIALMLASIALRLPAVLGYHGPPEPHPFNVREMGIPGAYSDIAHLYFRDQVWRHPLPYFDFRFEYPVLTGVFVWIASFAHASVAQYLVVSGLLLAVCGWLTVRLIARFEGANQWLFATAPALAFYSALNWDLLGLCLLVGALLLFERRRDVAGGAVLALGASAKLFPIVVLPIVVALRVADRRWRSAVWTAAAFAAVTLAVNAPFAIDTARCAVRSSWLYFFDLTNQRPPRATIWKPLLGHGADAVATPVLLVGLALIVALAVHSRRRPGGSLLPASAAALLWVFAAAKVYSPQYALWIFALLAIDGVPVAWVIALAGIDVLIFVTTFGPLYPGVQAFHPVQWVAYGLRQVLTGALVVWIAHRRLDAAGFARAVVERVRAYMGLARRPAAAIVGLTLLAALLRFATLAVKGFWGDEISTVLLVHQPFGQMLAGIARLESTPPLYYAVAWLWTKVFGTSEAGLRSLSALAGTATVPIVYLAARELLTRRAALIAAALIAVNPLLIWYSQEGRAYALLVLLTAAGLLWFARALRSGDDRALAYWAVASSLAFATHYFAAFLIVPEAAILLRARGARRRVVAALAGAGAAGAASLPLAAHQAGFAHAAWIGHSSLLGRIGQVPGQFAFGFEVQSPVLLGVAGALFLAGGAWLLVRRAGGPDRRGGARFAVVALVAIGLPIALSLAGFDYFNARNSIAVVVPMTIAVAAGYAVWRGSSRAVALGGVTAASLLAVALTVSQPKFHSEDWRDAAQDLGPTPWPRAVVTTPGQAGRKPLEYYLDASLPPVRTSLRVREVDLVALPRQGHSRLGRPALARLLHLRLSEFRVLARHVEHGLAVVRYVASRVVDVYPAKLNLRVGRNAATVVAWPRTASEERDDEARNGAL